MSCPTHWSVPWNGNDKVYPKKRANLGAPTVVLVTSARPEVRGTVDVRWRSLFPLPLNPPRTHSRIYHHMCLRTDGQWRTWIDGTDADAGCAPFLAVWGKGSAVCLGPRPASQQSPYTNYLWLGWWSTDRPLPMNDVSGRRVFNRGRAY